MITPCQDMDKVKAFMLLAEIYRYAAEFGADKDNATFSHGPQELWLDYDSIGLVNLHVETGAMCRFHPYILRARKAKYDNMVQEFFKWFIDNMPIEAVKLNAIIPVIFKGAILAAEAAKMTMEGIDRDSYRHDNGICDRLLFGITRAEIEKWVN